MVVMVSLPALLCLSGCAPLHRKPTALSAVQDDYYHARVAKVDFDTALTADSVTPSSLPPRTLRDRTHA